MKLNWRFDSRAQIDPFQNEILKLFHIRGKFRFRSKELRETRWPVETWFEIRYRILAGTLMAGNSISHYCRHERERERAGPLFRWQIIIERNWIHFSTRFCEISKYMNVVIYFFELEIFNNFFLFFRIEKVN